MMYKKWIFCLIFGLSSVSASAELIEFEASDFVITPTFNDVHTFSFSIELAANIIPGVLYLDPELIGVDYNVSGDLDGTPSGFPAFALVRTIGGDEFYSQGGSLSFQVAESADLSDGVQVSELAGNGLVFLFDAREVDTGRYHPPIFKLNSDSTGSILNSNNQGGVNPGSGLVVDVEYGEEYISELSFDPAVLTLIAPRPEQVYEDGFEAPLPD